MTRFLAWWLAAAVVATVGGALFDVAHGGTTLTRSIAYGFWLAAAGALVLMLLASSKLLRRAARLPVVEGWVFLTASILLTAVGIVVDLLGS
ncbi:MAG TPA: hypothetical protein VNY33_08340 [Gaiellaceae bacterium]|nr:hypothetical protein [Gaiellaceae bacterium]